MNHSTLNTRITLPHVIALTLGSLAVAYQSAVVWEALDGVSLILKLGVPLATVAAAMLPVISEASWRQGERAKALLMVLPVIALVAYVLPSGISRLGEAQQGKAQAVTATQDDIKEQRRLVTQSTGWVATECASGEGPKCKSQRNTLAQRTAYLEKLEGKNSVTPWLPAWHPALLPIGLELAIWTCFFFGFSPMTRRSAMQAVEFTGTRDLTKSELEEAKTYFTLTAETVAKLKSSGLKQHEIAAMYGLNQGRVSELMSGKRAEIVLH